MQVLEGVITVGAPPRASVKTTRDLAAGTPILRLGGTAVPAADRYSIQVDEGVHVLPGDQVWGFLNHACDPSCRIDFGTWTLVAARGIRAGEELTFSYLTTEWELCAPFACRCGAAACAGLIGGFGHLSPQAQEALRPWCSPYLRQRVGQRAAPVWRPEVYAFIPYEVRDAGPCSPGYDAPAYRRRVGSWLAELGLPWQWITVTLSSVQEQVDRVAQRAQTQACAVLNLCDGDEVHGFPGLSVVRALEQARLPYTGARPGFYEATTAKTRMKEQLVAAGVPTPPFVRLTGRTADLQRLTAHVGYPALVKPDISAASVGIGLRSVVRQPREAAALLACRGGGAGGPQPLACGAFAERFVDGPEFTVLVVADARDPGLARAYPAVERVFHPSLPPLERFLSFDRYWAEYRQEPPLPGGAPLYHYALAAPSLQAPLACLTERAFAALGGSGYARVDIRRQGSCGELQVLEVNANCGLSDDLETSVGQILRLCGASMPGLLRHLLQDARRRAEDAAGCGQARGGAR
ncbi:MAG: SET domain-containing protein-lysine N-methyltransferase [Candidatus Latescibacterota bacterium]